MKTKKKLSAIFAILIMIISFFAVTPFPATAQPPITMVAPLDMAYLDAAKNFAALGSNSLPMNVTLTHRDNASLAGKLLVMPIMLVAPAAGVNVSQWSIGFTWNPTVLQLLDFSNVSLAPGVLPPTLFELFTASATMTPAKSGLIPKYPPGHINVINGSAASWVCTANIPSYVYVNASMIGGYPFYGAIPLAYAVFLVNYYGESVIDFPITPGHRSETYLKDDTGTKLTPGVSILVGNLGPGNDFNGHFKFRIHEVAMWSDYKLEDGTKIGDTYTMPVSLRSTEPINSWSINFTFLNPLVLDPLLVLEGPYLQATEPGNTTFTFSTGPNWIKANCTYNYPSLTRTGDGVLMAVVFNITGYGKCPISITDFKADDGANLITPGAELKLVPGTPYHGFFEFEKMPLLALLYGGTTPYVSWTTLTHSIGETFDLWLMVPSTSQQVHSWKAGFTFNPAVVEVVSFVEDTSYFSSSTWIKGTINNATGVVTSFNCTGGTGVYGTVGRLATITFKVVGYGRTGITLTDSAGDPSEAKLEDLSDLEIATPYGLPLLSAVFQMRSPITVDLDLSSNCMEDYFIGEVFTVQLTINSAENMSAWQSGFYFDNTFLNCTGVTFGNVFSGAFQHEVKDNTAGYVSVGQYLVKPNVATGAGLLANITFEVIADGNTYLDLISTAGVPVQTVITDPNGDTCTLTSLVQTPWGHSAIVWKWGDVDGSGVVNILDVKKVKLTYSAIITDPFADTDYNGVVNILDVKKVKLIYSAIIGPPSGLC